MLLGREKIPNEVDYDRVENVLNGFAYDEYHSQLSERLELCEIIGSLALVVIELEEKVQTLITANEIRSQDD